MGVIYFIFAVGLIFGVCYVITAITTPVNRSPGSGHVPRMGDSDDGFDPYPAAPIHPGDVLGYTEARGVAPQNALDDINARSYYERD